MNLYKTAIAESKHFSPAKTSRRQFVMKTVPACALTCPACALTCMFSGNLLGKSTQDTHPEKHMFDQEFPRKLTFRQYFDSVNIQFIELAKAVQQKFGKDAVIDLIKKQATDYSLERGRKQAQGSSDTGLKSYTRMFSDPEKWKGLLKMEIVEDSDTAFELKVTECLQAATYLNYDAAEIGYANVCWGDYGWAEGFNPKIKLVRDKTLMQGDAYCNHRYVWTG